MNTLTYATLRNAAKKDFDAFLAALNFNDVLLVKLERDIYTKLSLSACKYSNAAHNLHSSVVACELYKIDMLELYNLVK